MSLFLSDDSDTEYGLDGFFPLIVNFCVFDILVVLIFFSAAIFEISSLEVCILNESKIL